jgi:hypothetical protein
LGHEGAGAELTLHELPTRGPWVALVSVLLIGSMPWLVCPRLGRWRAARGATAALEDLRGCLGAGDGVRDAELRLRSIAAEQADGDWPARCRTAAAQLEVNLSELEREAARCDQVCCPEDGRCQQLGYVRSALASVRASLTSQRFHDELVAALFGQSKELGLRGEALPASAPPPAAAMLVELPASGLLGRLGFDRLRGDTEPGGGAHLVFWQGRRTIACALGRGAARCRDVVEEQAPEPASDGASCALANADRASWQRGADDALEVSFGPEDGAVRQRAQVGSNHFGVACERDAVIATYIDKLIEEPLDALRPTARAAPLRGQYRVGRLRCRRSGCDEVHVEIELRRHRPDSRYLVTTLGDTALLLWRAPHGEVRMRQAPFDALAQSPDRLLVEGDEHGGARWERNAGLWVRDGVAYLIVERADEASTVHAIRFDAHGDVAVVPHE